jgi:hypothetical protein
MVFSLAVRLVCGGRLGGRGARAVRVRSVGRIGSSWFGRWRPVVRVVGGGRRVRWCSRGRAGLAGGSSLPHSCRRVRRAPNQYASASLSLAVAAEPSHWCLLLRFEGRCAGCGPRAAGAHPHLWADGYDPPRDPARSLSSSGPKVRVSGPRAGRLRIWRWWRTERECGASAPPPVSPVPALRR